MSRLLADENFPPPVARQLSVDGHDVELAAKIMPGSKDAVVLRHAREFGRSLLTFDSDFGDLIFLAGEAPPPAIFYFRLHPVSLPEVVERTRIALREFPDGQFVVVERDSIRTRAFPVVRG